MLNPKQQRFIDCYIENGGNATQALIQAGYTTRWPDRAAHILMKKPYIKRKLEEVREKMDSQIEATFVWKVRKLKKIVDTTTDEEIAIKAIAELNAMQGHYAPQKKMTVTADVDIIKLREMTEELMLSRAKPALQSP